MGLFDKLLQDGADLLKEVTSEENKEKASELFNNFKDVLGEKAQELNDALESYKAEQGNRKEGSVADESMYEYVDDGKTCRQKVLEVLSSEFPQYTVKENVSPTTLGGTGRFMEYSIVVYDGEEPKLIIMLIGKTTTSHREYRFSKEEAEKHNIAFINFIEHYPNTVEYITARLHKYL
jgi:hypothetical protein